MEAVYLIRYGAMGRIVPAKAAGAPARGARARSDQRLAVLQAAPQPGGRGDTHDPQALEEVEQVAAEEALRQRHLPRADGQVHLATGAGELLESVELFDVYVGDQLGADQQSLAFRMHFRAPDRTLTTQEVNAARDAAVTRAAQAHGAVQR